MESRDARPRSHECRCRQIRSSIQRCILHDGALGVSPVRSGVDVVVACLVIIVWAATGPLFHYSDTWQLVINTGTTIITFLMVFLIQNTQNRDMSALHLKRRRCRPHGNHLFSVIAMRRACLGASPPFGGFLRPPRRSVLALSAYTYQKASWFVRAILDVAATQRTVDLLRASKVPAIAILTRAPPRNDEETIETMKALEALGLPMFKTWMGERKVYRRALTQGQAVGEFDPSSKAAREINKIWREIERLDIAKLLPADGVAA
jgi:Low affinity iron permease